MDAMVLRSLARWPDVPAVYGWLGLDRRGNWRIKGGKVGNAALREFIGRNYAVDDRGCWFFQNGPQRVYASLAYTPLVVHYEDEGARLMDQCGRPFRLHEAFQDDEGSVLLAGEDSVALLDDRDLLRFSEAHDATLPVLARAVVPARFGFVQNPSPAASHSLHRP